MEPYEKNGFTLIELLVVLAILAVLAAVVIPSVTGMFEKGKVEGFRTDHHTIQASVFAYYIDVHDKPGPDVEAKHWYPTYDGGPGVIDFGLLVQSLTPGVPGPYLVEVPDSAAGSGGIYDWAVDAYGKLVNTFGDSASVSLVANFPFSKGSGSIAHDSSADSDHDNDGTLNDPAWIRGKVGSGLMFNGASDSVRVPYSTSLKVDGVLTLEAWIKPSNPGGGPQTILSHSPADGQYNYLLYLEGNDLKLSVYSPTSPDLVASNAIPEAGVWYHLAVTASKGGGMNLLVNGAQVAGGTAGTGFWEGGAMTVGDLRPDAGLGFDGAIDEVRIYSRALPSKIIRARYEATR